MYHDFARIHQALRVTPAMEAGIADHVWNPEEIVKLMKSRPEAKKVLSKMYNFADILA